MTNPFGNLGTEGLEETQDRLGGYAAKETDVYTGKIKVAYASEAASGAQALTIIADFGGDEYRETVYVSSGREKGQKNYYEKDGKKHALPGFTVADDLAQIVAGKPLSQLGFEDKVLNIYDPEQKKELPKSVKVATELTGQEVSFAILKSMENQTEKTDNGYVPKADGSTRDVNNIEKVFHTASKMTVAEAKSGATEAKFWDAWVERNKGKTRDKTEKSGNTGQAGAPKPGQNGSSAGAPRTSLFGGGAPQS